MPLLPGKKNVGHNIAEMEHAGHPRDVAIAAALRVARKARAEGGEVDPTEAQKEAGNYKKHHMRFQGLDIAIENRKGSTRSGVGPTGARWSVAMPADYGYIKRTEGADGDHVDCYVGPHADSGEVYVVDQIDPRTKKFDEHKCFLGFKSEADAVRTYDRGFSDGSGPRRRAAIHAMTVEGFKHWLKHGDTTKRVARAAGGGVEKMSRAAQTPGVRIKLANLNKNQHATETWDHNGPEVWLEHIASDVPGAGAEAMRKLVNHADATNTLLRLHHEDDGSGKLINYYKNFGFKADPAGGEIMERPPRQARASGGSVQEKLYTGPIHSPVAGRTDHLPVHVPSGSYVIPADIVSKFGEGNSMAGFKILRRMFAGTPYGGSGAPYGQGAGPYGQKTGATPYGGSGGPYNEKLASGGAAGSVPVIVAGGEYILTPDEVRMAGDGDLDTGHKVLDEFVVRTRKELIKTLQKLPPPKRD